MQKQNDSEIVYEIGKFCCISHRWTPSVYLEINSETRQWRQSNKQRMCALVCSVMTKLKDLCWFIEVVWQKFAFLKFKLQIWFRNFNLLDFILLWNWSFNTHDDEVVGHAERKRPSRTATRREMLKEISLFAVVRAVEWVFLLCIPILRHDFGVIWQWRSTVLGIAMYENNFKSTSFFLKLEQNVIQNIELFMNVSDYWIWWQHFKRYKKLLEINFQCFRTLYKVRFLQPLSWFVSVKVLNPKKDFLKRTFQISNKV